VVSVSQETPEDMETRLLRVTTQARLQLYPGTFAFLEFGLAEFPAAVRPDALVNGGTKAG